MTFCKESILKKKQPKKTSSHQKFTLEIHIFFLNQTLPLPKSTYIQLEVSNLHSKDFV